MDPAVRWVGFHSSSLHIRVLTRGNVKQQAYSGLSQNRLALAEAEAPRALQNNKSVRLRSMLVGVTPQVEGEAWCA